MTAAADQSSIIGGFSALLGYIGAEAATMECFERLLWPQRFFSGFRGASAPHVALLLPMGGPLHKAALTPLDEMRRHGLFKGPSRGDMLGTAFFRSQSWTYTVHGGAENAGPSRPLRNCLWARALALIPAGDQLVSSGTGDEEQCQRPRSVLRAHVAVHHLKLSAPSEGERETLQFVSEALNMPTWRAFFCIVTAEATAIFLFIGLLAAYHTAWSPLFLTLLTIRLLSASLSLRREELISATSSTSVASDPPLDFEVHCPPSDGSFMVLTGPPALSSQFPLGLLCSAAAWMPPALQYAWLSYQVYLVAAMHLERFARSGLGLTTEGRIAQALSLREDSRRGGNEQGAGILFGHERSGGGIVKATWSATWHGSSQDGKRAMEALLSRRQDGAGVRGREAWPDSANCEGRISVHGSGEKG